MEAWFSYIYQSLGALVRGVGQDAAPWLLLLILLIAGLLALREIILSRKAMDARDDRHAMNMMRLRGELAKRQALESRPQIEYWP